MLLPLLEGGRREGRKGMREEREDRNNGEKKRKAKRMGEKIVGEKNNLKKSEYLVFPFRPQHISQMTLRISPPPHLLQHICLFLNKGAVVDEVCVLRYSTCVVLRVPSHV